MNSILLYVVFKCTLNQFDFVGEYALYMEDLECSNILRIEGNKKQWVVNEPL